MSAQTIADDILKIAKEQGISLTPMQLMKLVYIAYGWALAMTGERIFNDRIEAWKYGPVIPNLYHATKHFGRNEIPHTLIGDTPITHPEIQDFLRGVVEGYGHFSGIALSNLTHKAGTPWANSYEPNVFGIQIPDRDILNHYKKALDARRSASAAS